MERLPGRGGGSGASLSSERCLSLVLASESVSVETLNAAQTLVLPAWTQNLTSQ